MTAAAVPGAPSVRLGGIASALGDLLPIDAMGGPEAPAELLERLAKNGFGTCSVADEPATRLAARSVAETLDRTGVDPADVDAVVHTACTFAYDETGAPAPVAARWGLREAVTEHVLRPSGLDSARLFGVWLAGSGNLASVLRLARSLVLVHGMRRVLCVTADTLPPGPQEFRAMRDGISVVADGASSCLVSADGPGPFLLDGVAQAASPKFSSLGTRQALQKRIEIMTGIRTAARRLFESTGTDAAAYRWLVTNNYARSTRGEFAQITGIGAERAFEGTVARIGHSFAADLLINLADLEATAPLAPGERALLLATGPLTWGAVAVRKAGAPAPDDAGRA